MEAYEALVPLMRSRRTIVPVVSLQKCQNLVVVRHGGYCRNYHQCGCRRATVLLSLENTDSAGPLKIDTQHHCLIFTLNYLKETKKVNQKSY